MSNISIDPDNKISSIRDPFAKNKVVGMSIRGSLSSFSETWLFHGTVNFKNGQTQGQQNFEGSSMDDLIIQVSAFVKNLD